MNNDQKIYRAAFRIACFIVGLVLLSGIRKIFDPASFALSVYRFHLLPDGLVNLVALYLPWLELISALCLLFIPRLRIAALWIALGLFSLFTTGISINLLRGTSFSCGCFGNSPLALPMNGMSVARNIALILIILLAFHAQKKSAISNR